MNDKVLKTVNKYNMISYGDKIVAAVSGGADSMAMLNFLISVRDRYKLEIIAAHMEHGIRGQESVEDAEFVKRYCNINNVEFIVKHINAYAEAEKAALSVEEYARNKRYEFFYSIPCDKIATAHNLSDNAETVLFRLIRGTGLKGMCGIPPVRDKIIRPFIEISSDEIRAFCRDNDIPYRIDSTNSRNDYSRNIIRNEIIPLFNSINSASEALICSFINTACEDYAFINNASNEAYKVCYFDNKLLIEKLKNYDISLVKRIIVKYFNSNNIELDKMHLDNVCKLIRQPSRVQIRSNIFAVSNKKYLRLAVFDDNTNNVKLIKEVLNINEFNAQNVDFYCDCDKIIGSVTFRKRLPGDAVRPVGRGCTKTVKKLFNELDIPVEKRDALCIVCDDIGIIGIVGICTDERVKVDSSTENILSIKLPPED